MTNIDYSSKEYYLKTWYNVLNVFLGWSESQVDEWVNRTGKLEPLNNHDDLIYHQQPCYWVIALITKELQDDEVYNRKPIDFNRYLRIFLLENEVKGLWPLDTNWEHKKTEFTFLIWQLQLTFDIMGYPENYRKIIITDEGSGNAH